MVSCVKSTTPNTKSADMTTYTATSITRPASRLGIGDVREPIERPGREGREGEGREHQQHERRSEEPPGARAGPAVVGCGRADEPCSYGAEPGTDRDEQCDGKQRGLEDLEIDPIAVHHHRPTEDAVERRHHRHDRTTEAGDERPGGEEDERREHTDQRGDDEESDGIGERKATDLEVVVALQSSHRVVRRQRQHAHRDAAAHAADQRAPVPADEDGRRHQSDRRQQLAPQPRGWARSPTVIGRIGRTGHDPTRTHLHPRRLRSTRVSAISQEPTTTRGRRCHIPDVPASLLMYPPRDGGGAHRREIR